MRASIRVAQGSHEHNLETGGNGTVRESGYKPDDDSLSGLSNLRESQQNERSPELSGEVAAFPTACKEQISVEDSEKFSRQIEEEIENLHSAIKNELAESTKKNYLTQWRLFSFWALNRNNCRLPADPSQVAAYLAERYEQEGRKPGSLYNTAAAISFIHRAMELNDPCKNTEVKRTLKRVTRSAGSLQRQAEALTAEVLSEIRATACRPRRGRGGRYESPITAESRGRRDIAMVCLMRDAMLRVSEAAALKWADIMVQSDGTGRLLIRRSKTDLAGEGAVAFLSLQTMNMVDSIRAGAEEGESVLGLRPNQISKRIKQAAQAAGLGPGFSGHSPRVGMARDLAKAGTELPSLMTAGRWSSPRMPALYTRNESAGTGAVAQYYNALRDGTGN